MDITQEVILIVIGSLIFLLAAIGIIVLIPIDQKKLPTFIFEKNVLISLYPPPYEN